MHGWSNGTIRGGCGADCKTYYKIFRDFGNRWSDGEVNDKKK